MAPDILPHLEEQARKRQASLNNKSLPERIPEASEGEAREHAAAAVDVNPRYVSDAKKLQREGKARPS